jgi:hypothetical protein
MPKTSRKHTQSTPQRRIDRHPRSWWHDHYRAWQAGDLSKSAYCAQQGLNVSSFSNWTTRFVREGGKTTPSVHPVFFKAQVPQASESITGRVQALSFQGLGITFEESIHSEALPAWVRLLKTC